MLRIRLRRTGKKKQPSYRVVVADQRAPRDGAFVEVIGHYNPLTKPKTLVLKEDRVRYWLERGAQPSETVHRLLFKEGLIAVEPPKRHTVPSRAEREAAAAAEATEAAEAAEAAQKAAQAAEAAQKAAEAAESTDSPSGDASDAPDPATESEA